MEPTKKEVKYTGIIAKTTRLKHDDIEGLDVMETASGRTFYSKSNNFSNTMGKVFDRSATNILQQRKEGIMAISERDDQHKKGILAISNRDDQHKMGIMAISNGKNQRKMGIMAISTTGGQQKMGIMAISNKNDQRKPGIMAISSNEDQNRSGIMTISKQGKLHKAGIVKISKNQGAYQSDDQTETDEDSNNCETPSNYYEYTSGCI